MGAFPALEPDSIEFSLGGLNVTEEETLVGGPIRFRHSLRQSSHTLQLAYENLSQSDMLLIRNHYNDSAGTHYHFTLPTVIWGGSSVLPASSVFRYESAPEESHLGVFNNVEVSLVVVIGMTLLYDLDGSTAADGTEETVQTFPFSGTAPFYLDGGDAPLTVATEYIVKGGGANS